MDIRPRLDVQNPYRYLFPIGGFAGVLGASLWIAFRLGWLAAYPISAHANLMIGGFVLNYAFGFLWTAIPRFFQAPMPGERELLPLLILAALTPFLGLLASPVLFHLAVLADVLLTIRFGWSRFRLRKGAPFPSFLFVLAGLLLAAASLFILALGSVVELPEAWLLLARAFFLKGFVIFLYLGIGMRLVPALTGWNPMPNAAPDRFAFDPLNLAVISAVLLGLWLEAQGAVAGAGLAYGSALLAAGLLRMRLAFFPKVRSALGVFVWASCLLISLAPLALLYDPGYATHFWHFVFIGGFGLLTVFVSLRVVLAHSGKDFLEWEKRPIFFVLGGLILLAMLARVSAPFATANILSHYAFAAGFWIMALVLWGLYFWKITKSKT